MNLYRLVLKKYMVVKRMSFRLHAVVYYVNVIVYQHSSDIIYSYIKNRKEFYLKYVYKNKRHFSSIAISRSNVIHKYFLVHFER